MFARPGAWRLSRGPAAGAGIRKASSRRRCPRFTVLKRRWVVERTCAWLGNYRPLSKDDEFLPSTGENLIYLAMSRLMLRRLRRPAK